MSTTAKSQASTAEDKLKELGIALPSPPAPQTCCKTCSERARTPADWCMEWQVSRYTHRWSWNSFSKWLYRLQTEDS